MEHLLARVIVIAMLLRMGGTPIDNYTYSGLLPTVDICDKQPVPSHMVEDWMLLARLVYSEAKGEIFEGKHAVADVVVYIAKDKCWTIKQTIYDRGRFDGIRNKWFYREPSEECYEAARLAILGKHVLPKGIFFYHNPRTSTDTKWVNFISKYAYKKIGNHLFCYHPKYYV